MHQTLELIKQRITGQTDIRFNLMAIVDKKTVALKKELDELKTKQATDESDELKAKIDQIHESMSYKTISNCIF